MIGKRVFPFIVSWNLDETRSGLLAETTIAPPHILGMFDLSRYVSAIEYVASPFALRWNGINVIPTTDPDVIDLAQRFRYTRGNDPGHVTPGLHDTDRPPPAGASRASDLMENRRVTASPSTRDAPDQSRSAGPVLIAIDDATLRHWAATLLPIPDVWYLDDAWAPDLTGCVVMPRDFYLRHPDFQRIEVANAYLHWQISSEVTQVALSGPGWVTALADADRTQLLERQVALRRGLVMPRAFFDDIPDGLEQFVVGDDVVLCHAAWDAVPERARHVAVRREQTRWDELDTLPLPLGAPVHVQAIAGAFHPQEGANCFSTVAACTTGEAWMLRLWLHPPTLLELLDLQGYRPIDGADAMTDDVLTFAIDGTIIHAAWCAGSDRFVNKNGQSRFNPVRVVDRATLARDWPDTLPIIHRRRESPT